MTAHRSGRRPADTAFFAMLALSAVLLVATIQVVFLKAPIEARMGIVQKIFYFHVPSAYAMYLGATACFGGSVAYLLRPTDVRDAIARAGAEAAIVFGAVVLVTGPLWGAKAWGVYWTWDPRLTTALLSWLIYVSYTVLRSFSGDGPGERRIAAALVRVSSGSSMTPRASSVRVASSSPPTSLAVARMASAVSLKRRVASASACCISRIMVCCV